jgi:hypothetical protein
MKTVEGVRLHEFDLILYAGHRLAPGVNRIAPMLSVVDRFGFCSDRTSDEPSKIRLNLGVGIGTRTAHISEGHEAQI